MMRGRPSLNLGVFKTSAPPVELLWSGQTPAAPTSADPTVVSFTTTQPPSPEEKLYLRWTTDTFTDSPLVPATGSGNDLLGDDPSAAGKYACAIYDCQLDRRSHALYQVRHNRRPDFSEHDQLSLCDCVGPDTDTNPDSQPRQHPHLLLRQRHLLPQHLRRHQLRPPCLLQLQLNQSTNQSQSEKPQNSVFAPLALLL